jgi:hypothetical protein
MVSIPHIILSVFSDPNNTGIVYILFFLSPSLSTISNNNSQYNEPEKMSCEARDNIANLKLSIETSIIDEDNPEYITASDTNN